MALKINKSGVDINGEAYPYLHVTLGPQVELQYDRVSVRTNCFNGADASVGYGPTIIPEGWAIRFDPIKIQYEEGAENDLENWVNTKVMLKLSTEENIPYEYMQYENDVFELDPSTGEQVLDPSTGQPIKLHTTGELITKANGTHMFYTKTLPAFCEADDLEIV